MRKEIVDKLLALNRSFYQQFAEPFSQSRETPQPGFYRLLEEMQPSISSVLDVGCGNGRFGRFLQQHIDSFEYTGVDFSTELLHKADEVLSGNFYQRDISQRGFLKGLGKFDVIVCLATMQHIPGRLNRSYLLKEIGNSLAVNGLVFLANWQFMDSPRQVRKIQDWELADINFADLEPNDYLLSWQRDGFGLRYVCMIDAKETAELASEAGLLIRDQFRSDGKEGNLNLYTVLAQS